MKNLLAFTVLICSLLATSSCSESSEDYKETPAITGVWNIYRFTETKIINGYLISSPDYWSCGTLKILNNGTANLFMRNTNYDYTYTQKGNIINFHEKGSNLDLPYTVRYCNDTLLVVDYGKVCKDSTVFRTFQLTKPKR